MDKGKGKNVLDDDRIIEEEDMISKLPDSLLCLILMNLSTKEVVKTSLLCRRWRNVWQSMSGLDFTFTDISTEDGKFKVFNRFEDLKFLQRIKLRYFYGYDHGVEMSINTALRHKTIRHLDVGSTRTAYTGVKIPPTIYTSCERLVSLKLYHAILPKPHKSVSLPCLKIIDLQRIVFDDILVMEMLISGCPVLETLTTDRICGEKVSSRSLISLSITEYEERYSQHRRTQVILKTPRLKYLKLTGCFIDSIILNDHLASIVKLELGMYYVDFRESFRSFLIGISGVREMTISACSFLTTLDDIIISSYSQNQVTCGFSKSESLPKFYNLSALTVKDMIYEDWRKLIVFLESCPNLKYLVMKVRYYGWVTKFSDGPQCLFSSLEFVDIHATNMTNLMKFATYILENSTILKKLTLWLDLSEANESMILKKLLALPRRPETCRVVIRSAEKFEFRT